MNTVVFVLWSINCFPCLRSILFSLGWSMFWTCFHPEDSLCLNKFCSSATADVEAGVVVARMFSFLHLSVSFCCSSFYLFFFFFGLNYFFLNIHYTVFYRRQLTTTLAQFFYHTALWMWIIASIFLLFTLWLGLFVCKRTKSCPRWPHFLSNRCVWLAVSFHLNRGDEYRWELVEK